MADDHTAILLEDIRGKLDGLAESMSFVLEGMRDVRTQGEDIAIIKADVKTIKAVQIDQGQEIRHIEQYLTAQGMPQRA